MGEKEKKKADMSAAATKAWATRRQKYGESGLSKRAGAKKTEEAGAEHGAEGYFCDYCGAGPFEKSWQKAQHVKACPKARAAKSKQA